MRGFFIAGFLATLSIQVLGHHGNRPNSGLNRRAVDLASYRPQPKTKYVNADELRNDPSVRISKRGDYLNTAIEFAKDIGPDVTYRVLDGHYVGTNGIAHVHFRQTIHGIDLENAELSVNVGSNPPLCHVSSI